LTVILPLPPPLLLLRGRKNFFRDTGRSRVLQSPPPSHFFCFLTMINLSPFTQCPEPLPLPLPSPEVPPGLSPDDPFFLITHWTAEHPRILLTALELIVRFPRNPRVFEVTKFFCFPSFPVLTHRFLDLDSFAYFL